MTLSCQYSQARRLFLLSAVSAAVLSGCGGGTRPPGGAQPPGTYRVALLAPLSGEDREVGQALANAARLALDDMNNRSIRLTVFNTAEGGAAAAASRAIATGNRLILGPLLSDQVRAVAPIARSARVPVLAFSNDEAAAGGGVFILGFVPGQSVATVVGHARRSGASRFAGLMPASAFGQRAGQAFVASVQRSGGQVTGMETYAPGAARGAARKLNGQGGFDAVLIGDGGRGASQAAPQIRAGVRIIGTELWAGDRSLGQTSRLRGAWFAAPSDARFGQFAGRYRARFGNSPVRLASIGYDAMLLTVRATRNWSPGRRFPFGALVDDEGFLGVDGVFRFGRDGVAQRGLEVRQVTANGSTVVAPAPSHFDR